MRAFLRTVLLTMLVTLAALGLWSWLSRSGSSTAASASQLNVPPRCVPPEWAGIQSLLSKTTDPAGRKSLEARRQALERAAMDCAANAARPRAPKPANADLLPNAEAVVQPTLPAGMRNVQLLPTEDFLPGEDGNNMWVGTLNGQNLQVFAGASATSDPDWQAQHPEWAAEPAMHVQGALRIVTEGNTAQAVVYPTPERHGSLQLLAQCGTLLIVQAADGTQMGFDLATLQYASGPASCP